MSNEITYFFESMFECGGADIYIKKTIEHWPVSLFIRKTFAICLLWSGPMLVLRFYRLLSRTCAQTQSQNKLSFVESWTFFYPTCLSKRHYSKIHLFFLRIKQKWFLFLIKQLRLENKMKTVDLKHVVTI